jgi:hypothetical protein
MSRVNVANILPLPSVIPAEGTELDIPSRHKRILTSQTHTSKTAAAMSYAVSPQLLRTRGLACCFVRRYRTTGRWPLDAAFTDFKSDLASETKKKGSTQGCPSTFALPVHSPNDDIILRVHYFTRFAVFAKISDNV